MAGTKAALLDHEARWKKSQSLINMEPHISPSLPTYGKTDELLSL